ncbi:MAG TPA: M20/M25/M40 family metallo-hydrolase [Acidimicrobiales bacterium]|nr:M20/M25/M40 family metallo-hydrolase [Acidimicrobiales bacterium]
MKIDTRTGEVVELLQALIRNRCVNTGEVDSGDESRNADVLSDVLGSSGLDVQRFHHPATPNRSCIVARIQGSDPDAPSLALMGHTDVVPVSAESWSRDPFGGEIVDGEVWGRGAVDMLNQTAAMAIAVRRLADAGFAPRGTLLYLGVADEEAGSVQGVKHLLEAEPDAVRADYVLTEIGGIVSEGSAGTNVEVVTAEKGGAVVDIVVTGTPSHGSTPFGADNAVVKAAEVVRRLAEHRPETHISDSWRGWVEGQPFDAELKAVLTDPVRLWDALPDLPTSLAARAHSCTHTTYAPTVIHGGHKRNIICDRVVVQPDIRIAHGESVELVVGELHRMLEDLGDCVEINVVRSGEPTESSTDTPLWAALERAARRAYPDAHLLASPLTGATDARFFRQAGIPSYGFGLLSRQVTPQQYWSRFHGNDERIDVESLRLSADMWEQLARDFLE